MTYVFDIDGTICYLTDGEYKTAVPFEDKIEKINQLYDEGHTIIFHTARGMGRTNNSSLLSERLFKALTMHQLKEWGAKHHKLFMGKPSGDIYIDDKGVHCERFFTNEEG